MAHMQFDAVKLYKCALRFLSPGCFRVAEKIFAVLSSGAFVDNSSSGRNGSGRSRIDRELGEVDGLGPMSRVWRCCGG